MQDNEGRLLLVDDESAVLEALRSALRKDVLVDTAPDAATALELFKTRAYAVVVTDLMMPGTNGLQLARQLRQLDPNTVCVVLSGRINDAAELGMHNNVFAVMHKPCRLDHLVDVVQGALAEYVLRLHQAAVA